MYKCTVDIHSIGISTTLTFSSVRACEKINKPSLTTFEHIWNSISGLNNWCDKGGLLQHQIWTFSIIQEMFNSKFLCLYSVPGCLCIKIYIFVGPYIFMYICYGERPSLSVEENHIWISAFKPMYYRPVFYKKKKCGLKYLVTNTSSIEMDKVIESALSSKWVVVNEEALGRGQCLLWATNMPVAPRNTR